MAPCILQSGSKILTLAAPDGEALDGAFGTYKGEYWQIKNNKHNIDHHKMSEYHNVAQQSKPACKSCDIYFDGHTMQVNRHSFHVLEKKSINRTSYKTPVV